MGKIEMECPYLKPLAAAHVCNASDTKMVPSEFEFTIYCNTEEHYRCPILLARTLRDGRIDALQKAGAMLSR